MSTTSVPPNPLAGPFLGLPTSIQMTPAVAMTQDQFFEFCQQNPDKRFERTAEGELIIMPPIGFDGGLHEGEVYRQLANWALAAGNGKATNSNVAFILPNGANRAPDAAWVSPEQLASLTPEQRKKFPPLCPFFVVEVRSPSDTLKKLQEKMEEYIANGCQLGWLIDPDNKQVHVYRPGQPVQVLDNPPAVSGEPELPGFVLDLERVWQA